MVDFIFDEQNFIPRSVFLKINDGSKIKLKSNLLGIDTFYHKKTKQRILWEKGINEKKTRELYYFGEVDGENGVIRLPISVFLSMNETERLIGKSKRNFEWIISKKGEGLNTRYTTIKGNEVLITDEEIKKNNEKLKKIIEPYYKKLQERLTKYKQSNVNLETIPEENLESINLDDIS